MVNILIKSCNRAYYLDRCLHTIYQFVSGQFAVRVLDDGTPPEYLARIAEKYPQAEIIRSPLYEAKVDLLNAYLHRGETFKSLGIPVQFWIDAVATGTKYFLLLEDDVWLTRPVDVSAIEAAMQHERMVMVRLMWQGNLRLITGQRQRIDSGLEEILPSIPSWRSFVFTNRFKVRSVGYRLGLFQDIMPYQVPLYVLYAVVGALFDKDYWLYLWEGAGTRVLEEFQLNKALHWYKRHHSRYGKVAMEGAQTSYITSTTNSLYGIECDMLRINYLLNEAWLSGRLDATQHLPKDFTLDYLAPFIQEAANGQALYNDWLVWIARFKMNYRILGCEVE